MHEIVTKLNDVSRSLRNASIDLRAQSDYSHRLTLLADFVAREKELPGCCVIDVTFPSGVLRISVDMRDKGAVLALGAPGEIWIELDENGATSFLMATVEFQTVQIDDSTKKAAESSVDAVIQAIRERGRFVSIDEGRRELGWS